MADQTRRLSPSVLQADTDALNALKNIPDYKPANAGYTLDADETQKQAALDSARDDATTAEWQFHNAILGVKEQVRAQFGADSNELQALGLVKKSEKAKPAAPKPAPTPVKS